MDLQWRKEMMDQFQEGYLSHQVEWLLDKEKTNNHLEISNLLIISQKV